MATAVNDEDMKEESKWRVVDAFRNFDDVGDDDSGNVGDEDAEVESAQSPPLENMLTRLPPDVFSRCLIERFAAEYYPVWMDEGPGPFLATYFEVRGDDVDTEFMEEILSYNAFRTDARSVVEVLNLAVNKEGIRDVDNEEIIAGCIGHLAHNWQSIRSEQDQKVLEKLPDAVKVKIYSRIVTVAGEDLDQVALLNRVFHAIHSQSGVVERAGVDVDNPEHNENRGNQKRKLAGVLTRQIRRLHEFLVVLSRRQERRQ